MKQPTSFNCQLTHTKEVTHTIPFGYFEKCKFTVQCWAWDPRIPSSNPTRLLNLYQVGLTLLVILPRSARMSASMLLYCVGVATRPGLCPIAKESASAAPTLCTEYGPNGWMDSLSFINRGQFTWEAKGILLSADHGMILRWKLEQRVPCGAHSTEKQMQHDP